MSDVVKMDYPAMEEMANAFKQASESLQDLVHDMQASGQILESGALLGRGGDIWNAAINQRLIPRIKKLDDKMLELQGDIWGALVDMRDGDHEAQSRFKG